MGRLLPVLLLCVFALSTFGVIHPHPHARVHRHVQPEPVAAPSFSSFDDDGRVKDGDQGRSQLGEWLEREPPSDPLLPWRSSSANSDLRLHTLALLTRDDLRTKRNFGLEIPDVIMGKFDGGDGQRVRARLNHMGRRK